MFGGLASVLCRVPAGDITCDASWRLLSFSLDVSACRAFFGLSSECEAVSQYGGIDAKLADYVVGLERRSSIRCRLFRTGIDPVDMLRPRAI
jgi:hypothetical protein